MPARPEYPSRQVSYREALGVWLRVAALSFGGPAGQIAVMHWLVVEERGWVDEPQFLHALNFCMLLPGPEAQQLATYLGWLLHWWRGALTAGILFIIPGFLSILGLSILYVRAGHVPVVRGVLEGIRAAVLAIVVDALLRIGRRALVTPAARVIAAGSFVALFFFGVPYPAVLVAAGLAGWLTRERDEPVTLREGEIALVPPPRAWPSRHALSRTAGTALLWLAIRLAPLVALRQRTGKFESLYREAAFFTRVAAVTFGGAYAALAYVAQEAVHRYHWVLASEMLDGLGLAETTPGPLIQVVQFVGFMGGYRAPGPLAPMAGGILASVVVAWVTFAPSFLWVLTGAPYVERLRTSRSVSGVLAGISAAVVGVILNLSVWFALHVAFAWVSDIQVGPVHLLQPHWASRDGWALATVAFAFIALFRWRLGVLFTLLVAGAAGAFHVLVWR